MRREAGAIIVILLCFLLKLPGLLDNERWRAGSSGTVDKDVTADSIDLPRLLDVKEERGIDTGRRRLNGDASYKNPHSARPHNTHTGQQKSYSSPPHQFKVIPPEFFENPLEYLSNAAPESLVFLPGVGPVLAERIADAASGKRPFTRWEDLLSIKGIGPKKLEKLRRFAKAR